jgi:hypothetical protein
MQRHRILKSFLNIQDQNLKNLNPIAVDVPRPIQWHHSHADLIWPESNFKQFYKYVQYIGTYQQLSMVRICKM